MNESERRYRQRLVRPMLAFAALAALAVVLAPTGSAKAPSSGNKVVDYCLQYSNSPDCSTPGAHSVLPGATSPTLTLKITNDSSSGSTLGSVNFDAPTTLPIDTGALTPTVSPAGDVTKVAVAGTGGELQIRNLNLAIGATATVTFAVDTPCAGTGIVWPSPAAKQSNNFLGTGNDFTVGTKTGMTSDIQSGSCKLAFITEPANANFGQLITDSPYNPTVDGTSVHYVTVAAENSNGDILTSLNSGSVSLSVAGGSFDNTSDHFTFTSPNFSGGYARFTDLSATGTGSNFTLTASSSGFADATSAPPFNITSAGVTCNPATSCDLPTADSGGSPLDINGSGGFTFLGASPFTLPLSSNGTVSEPGCQNLYPVSGSGFAELDGRTNINGTLTVSIFVDMKKIKAKYGANTGQQFIPICIGVKYLVTDTTGTHPVDCNPLTQTPWKGDQIANSGTKSVFTGIEQDAQCGSGGYWWDIVSSFQDKLDTNPPTQYPEVTSWTTVTIGNTTYREFVLTLPPGIDLKGGY